MAKKKNRSDFVSLYDGAAKGMYMTAALYRILAAQKPKFLRIGVSPGGRRVRIYPMTHCGKLSDKSMMAPFDKVRKNGDGYRLFSNKLFFKVFRAVDKRLPTLSRPVVVRELHEGGVDKTVIDVLLHKGAGLSPRRKRRRTIKTHPALVKKSPVKSAVMKTSVLRANKAREIEETVYSIFGKDMSVDTLIQRWDELPKTFRKKRIASMSPEELDALLKEAHKLTTAI